MKQIILKNNTFWRFHPHGVEKVLKKDKHLKKSIGEEVQIKLFNPIDKNKQFIGKLKSFNDKEIVLEIENNNKSFERNNISQIKTVYKW